MRNPDQPVLRSVDRREAPPGWCLAVVAVVQARPGERYDRPGHRHHTVEVVLAGRGRVRVGGQERVCVAGDSYHLPAGADHLIEADRRQPWRKLYCDIHGPFVDQLRAAYGLDGHIFPAADISRPLRALLDHRGDDRSLQLLGGQVLQEVIASWAAIAVDDGLGSLVRDAKRLIDDGLEQPLRVRDIAAALHCSEAHLARQFRRQVGVAPGAYQLQRRMDVAMALLGATAEPIKVIAERLCYSDAFAFSHAFKQVVGVAPTSWRRRHGGG